MLSQVLYECVSHEKLEILSTLTSLHQVGPLIVVVERKVYYTYMDSVPLKFIIWTLLPRWNLSSLWVSRTGSASDRCALQEALYKCTNTIQYNCEIL